MLLPNDRLLMLAPRGQPRIGDSPRVVHRESTHHAAGLTSVPTTAIVAWEVPVSDVRRNVERILRTTRPSPQAKTEVRSERARHAKNVTLSAPPQPRSSAVS